MTTLKIIYRKTNELKKYESNARTHSAEQIQQIVNSIKEFGWTNPILIDENDIIIAGHGRLTAAEMLNTCEVPCIVLSGLTESQKRAYLIADNQLALNAGWDFNLLQAEIEALKLDDFDISLLGFSDGDMEEIIDMSNALKAENNNDNPYSATVATPLYLPHGDKPSFDEMYNTEKLSNLLSKINKAQIAKDIKDFLVAAAYRHILFNYEQIANFYAHSDREVQTLMEDSALIIIDFEKSIEQGYIKLTEEVNHIYETEYQ